VRKDWFRLTINRYFISRNAIVVQRFSLHRRFCRSFVGILYNIPAQPAIEASGSISWWRKALWRAYISESPKNSVANLYIFLNQTDRPPILVSCEKPITP
jgi:hypothetical protein